MTATRTRSGWQSQWAWLSWVLVVIVVSAALVIGVLDNNAPRTNLERTSDIAATIRCPKCTGQSVAESDVAVARVILADIGRQVDAGASDAQIRESLVEGYGEGILLTPSGEGLVGLVWVIPVIAGAAASLALAFAFTRWRRELATEDEADDDIIVSDADVALVAAARAGSVNE